MLRTVNLNKPMNQKFTSSYDILRVSAQASDAEIKRAYRILALQYHPDRNPMKRDLAARRFREITEAYSNLKTREKRERYNQSLRSAAESKAENGNGNDNGWLTGFTGSFLRQKKYNEKSGSRA